MYTREDIEHDLTELGLGEGDIVLARAGLRSLGPIQGGRVSHVVIQALLNVVGPQGTVLGLAHTQVTKGIHRKKAQVFRRDTPCITGGLAAAMLGWPGAHRSTHPTNSVVAIGKYAEDLVADHDENSTCFSFMRKLVDINAKMMHAGCDESSPGFSTVHLTYEALGLARKSILSGLYGTYYEKDGVIFWFAKRDVPGCSKGFRKFYDLYRKAGILHEGELGDAQAYLISSASVAFQVEQEAVRKDPAFSLCDDSDCYSCRGTKYFNFRDMPRYYLRHPGKLRNVLLRLGGFGTRTA
jgi:aminoglycoside N3'-acetyltransferase